MTPGACVHDGEHGLAALPVVPCDLDVARVHARLDAELSAAGTPVGDADPMVAATAVWLDYPWRRAATGAASRGSPALNRAAADA